MWLLRAVIIFEKATEDGPLLCTNSCSDDDGDKRSLNPWSNNLNQQTKVWLEILQVSELLLKSTVASHFFSLLAGNATIIALQCVTQIFCQATSQIYCTANSISNVKTTVNCSGFRPKCCTLGILFLSLSAVEYMV